MNSNRELTRRWMQRLVGLLPLSGGIEGELDAGRLTKLLELLHLLIRT